MSKEKKSKTQKMTDASTAAVENVMKEPTRRSITSMIPSKQSILRELQEHNDFFDFCVDIIPAKIYIAASSSGGDGDGGDNFNPRYFKKAQKSDFKEARRAAAKLGKRQKLHPDTAETTVAKKQRLARQEQEKELSEAAKLSMTTAANASNGSNSTGGKQQRHQPSSSSASLKMKEKEEDDDGTNKPLLLSKGGGASRIEALRAKLHAKIAAQQGNRPTTGGPGAVSKRAARRAEKLRRKEEAAKRKQQGGAKTMAGNKNTTTIKSYTVSPSPHGTTTTSDDLAQMDFGRLTGLNDAASAAGAGKKKNSSSHAYIQSNKSLQNLSKPKNLKKMLEDAQAKQKRLKELSAAASTDEAAAEKKKKMQWTDAFSEADGTRIKDDPARLKKKIAKKQAQKKKSQKAWKTRLEQTATAAKNRQAIRSHNLKTRKVGGAAGANLSRKEIKTTDNDNNNTATDTKKQPRLSRPGFEGRKRGFLNGSGSGGGGGGDNAKSNKNQ